MINVWLLCILILVGGGEGFTFSSFHFPAKNEICKTFKGDDYVIRFPFRLKEQPIHCGYRGFELSYTENKQTMLELPHDLKLAVKSIDYKEQTIDLFFNTKTCFVLQLPNLDLYASPFRSSYSESNRYAFFNCSRKADGRAYKDYIRYTVHCLSGPGYQVVAFSNDSQTSYNDVQTSYNLLNCRRTLLDLSSKRFISTMLYLKTGEIIRLSWTKPNCSRCEAEGSKCRLKTNKSTTSETECYGSTKKQRDIRKVLLVVGLSLASWLVGLVLFKLYRVLHSYIMKKEDQRKIEKFLQEHKALKPSRYSYADIKRITYQFKDKIGQGAVGSVFKGRLSNDVLVAVKVLDNFIATGEEFISEVGSMCMIHHINVTRLIGFCADGNKRALVYELMPNESLNNFIFRAREKEDRFLSWEKLESIAVGIAKGIEYLHNGCDQQILHFDIKPHNILLDHNFNPKISDFGLAKLCSKEQSAVTMTAARGTMGYIASEVLPRNFGKASHKSDVYSFGMLLLEMVGGRRNINVRMAYNYLDRGEELDISIENEAHSKIARKLTTVGLLCIQWYPADRPSMKDVIHMLEGEVESLTIPPNPFGHAVGMEMGARQPRELTVINELE